MIGRLEEASGKNVSRETFQKLEFYVARLKEESKRQNLVSGSTLEQVWDRHIVDSAQLARYAPRASASWVDVGSGAGFPGIVLACILDGPITMVEPRRLRADFLHRVTESLELRATVLCKKVERVEQTFDVITARAVAPLEKLLKISAHLSTRKTVWALPKGRGAQGELAEALRAWQGAFELNPSVTDTQGFIVVATGVRAKT